MANGRSWSESGLGTPPTGLIRLEMKVPRPLVASPFCCSERRCASKSSDEFLRPSFGDRERLCRSMTWSRPTPALGFTAAEAEAVVVVNAGLLLPYGRGAALPGGGGEKEVPRFG